MEGDERGGQKHALLGQSVCIRWLEVAQTHHTWRFGLRKAQTHTVSVLVWSAWPACLSTLRERPAIPNTGPWTAQSDGEEGDGCGCSCPGPCPSQIQFPLSLSELPAEKPQNQNCVLNSRVGPKGESQNADPKSKILQGWAKPGSRCLLSSRLQHQGTGVAASGRHL